MYDLHRCIYYVEENTLENCFVWELFTEGLDTRLKGVLTRSSSCGTPKLQTPAKRASLGGPYTTICNCMKIARYGENCSVPSLERLHPHLGIYEFTACALRHEGESRAAESRPPKTSMIDTILRERHASLTRYFPRSIRAKIPFFTQRHLQMSNCRKIQWKQQENKVE